MSTRFGWPRRHFDGPLTDELVRTPGRFGLGQVPTRLAPDATTSMVCGFCSTGCSLDVHLRDGKPVNITPTVDYPVNDGMACPKGWEALTPMSSADRLTRPMVRGRSGRLEPVDWDTAIGRFVDGVRSVQDRHGPEAMAFLSTGQIPTEEMALLGALTKFGMGIVHGDGNTRQCMATAVTAYKECFGFDAPPYTYEDFEESDVIVLWGSNLAIAHPIMWQRIARSDRDPTIIAVDPRRTETAAAAQIHLAANPASDLTLAYGLAKRLIERGAVDARFVERHTSGFDTFAAHVAQFDSARVEADAGVSPTQLDQAVDAIAGAGRASFWWTMGVNQSHQGVRTAQAIIALALMTGNIGRPGTGANSITGQCNAMGSRLFSNTSGLLGGRDFADATDRAEVAEIVGVPESVIPRRPSWAYDRILEGIAGGEIRGLWVVATNTAHSWINQTDCHDLLDRLDLLVVQDLYPDTETAQRADIVLPAAGWGEKDGTFINSERRIGLVKKVKAAPGQALADFWIFKAIADAWGCSNLFSKWTDPEAVFEILQSLSAAQPCDFTGVNGYSAIEAARGIQWPVIEGDEPATHRRLFGDGRFFTDDGRARFVVDEPRRTAEATSARYPLVLLTGRGSSAEWHTQTRTGRSPVLRQLSPSLLHVEIHPDDAATLGIATGDDVVVSSPRGSLPARALVTATVGLGRVFLPMHHPETNRLTFPSFDPHSRQPAYKYAAVEVRLMEPWESRGGQRLKGVV
ncbi:MAG TPA: molybdopterin-dependent oxidoreductase [Acidimicrobiales bacterium]